MSPELQRTRLYDLHRESGARMVPFAGFSMPVQYHSIVAEHLAVRASVGLFDVSHMGQIHVSGPASEASLEKLLTCPVASLRPGRVRYGCLCNDDGGVVDDVTVYRLRQEAFFLCVNASNIAKDLAWIEAHAGGATVEDRSETTALLALQGPEAGSVIEALGNRELVALKRFAFVETELAGVPLLASRTGYTGEDGFELYLSSELAVDLWRRLRAAGEVFGLSPVGLGARDTLRLEAAFPLYGHELTDETSPLDAGLSRFVKLEDGGFIGHEAIVRRAASGTSRLLRGLSMEERGIPRAGYPIAAGGHEIGYVTSGGPSPTLQRSIALGYVQPEFAGENSEIHVVIRERPLRARICETPFV